MECAINRFDKNTSLKDCQFDFSEYSDTMNHITDCASSPSDLGINCEASSCSECTTPSSITSCDSAVEQYELNIDEFSTFSAGDSSLNSPEEGSQSTECDIDNQRNTICHSMTPMSEKSSQSELNKYESRDSNIKSSPSKGVFDENHEFEYLSSEPVKRSTSLKTNRKDQTLTAQKKVVRFADAMGLDLETIRHVLNNDEPPEVPLSAMKDLNLADGWGSTSAVFGSTDSILSASSVGPIIEVQKLCFCFTQPGQSPDFIHRILERNVLLEMTEADDINRVIRGVVGVANLAFDKTVIVRWTQNGWLTHDDVIATWVSNCNEGSVDRFGFSINLPVYFSIGCRLEFSILYICAGETYWDSNYGSNYRVECFAGAEL